MQRGFEREAKFGEKRGCEEKERSVDGGWDFQREREGEIREERTCVREELRKEKKEIEKEREISEELA